MALAQEKQEMERSNRRILEEIEWKKLEIEREEEIAKEEIKHIQKNFNIKEELIESEVKIDVCTKFEQEYQSLPVENGVKEHIQKFLQYQQELTVPASEEPPAVNTKASSSFQATQKAVEAPTHNVISLNPSAPTYVPSAVQPPAGFYPHDCANSGQKGTTEVKTPDISF